jgi:hypothetical protein
MSGWMSLMIGAMGVLFLGACADRDCVLTSLPSPILNSGLHKRSHVMKTPQVAAARPAAPTYIPSSYQIPVPAVIAPANWYPPVRDNCWKVIVVHHSASETGGARAFDVAHRARGWDELGYHFVIGNGTDTPDGYVEVGPRWFKQKHGAHCKTPDNFYNDYGIGICLVGNFDETSPSPKQMESLRKLVTFLMQRYQLSPGSIYGHGEVRGTATDCPGRYFPMVSLRYSLSNPSPIWASSTK